MTESASPASGSGRGRRPGQSTTRAAILEAARARFSAGGYSDVSIRQIAADAHVDPALIMQFFGSKERLFGAVMAIEPETMQAITAAFADTDDGAGERVARTFLELFEGDARRSAPLLAMLRAAVTHDDAAAQLREFLQARLAEDVAPHRRDDPEMLARVGVVASMLIGVVVARRIVRVPSIAEESLDGLVARVAPAVEVVLADD